MEPEKENLQNVPPEVCASWYRNFSVGRHIVIESLEDIRGSWTLDRLYQPNLEAEKRTALLRGWHEAVGRVRSK